MVEDGSGATAAPLTADIPTDASSTVLPPSLPKQKGKVKWFNSSKGYGFLTPDVGDDTEDVFVHQTVIYAQGFRSLQQGEEVEYVAKEGEDGRWRAMEVTGIRGAYVQGAARYGSRGGRGRAQAASGAASSPAIAAPAPPASAPRYPRFGGVCYSCGLIGHVARDCRSAVGAFYPPVLSVGRGRGRGGGGGPPPYARSCYACGVVGHLQRDCPKSGPA